MAKEDSPEQKRVNEIALRAMGLTSPAEKPKVAAESRKIVSEAKGEPDPVMESKGFACEVCGSLIAEDDKFCPHCGTRVTVRKVDGALPRMVVEERMVVRGRVGSGVASLVIGIFNLVIIIPLLVSFFGLIVPLQNIMISATPYSSMLRVCVTFSSLVLSAVGVYLAARQQYSNANWIGNLGFIISLGTLVLGLTLTAALMLSYLMRWETAAVARGFLFMGK